MGAEAVELRPELAEMGEVADPDRAAADLVLIGRADAAPGGADLAGAAASSRSASRSRWKGRISGQVSAICRLSGVIATPCSRQLLDLGLQRPGIEHDAVADHRQRAADDARGQQRQLVGLVADDERVAGIVAALEADDDVGAARQPVDDLALALVAPLAADHGDVRQDSMLPLWN